MLAKPVDKCGSRASLGGFPNQKNEDGLVILVDRCCLVAVPHFASNRMKKGPQAIAEGLFSLREIARHSPFGGQVAESKTCPDVKGTQKIVWSRNG